MYASAAMDKTSDEMIIKLVNTTGEQKARNINIRSSRRVNSTARIISLQSDDLEKVNSIDNPKAIFPVEQDIPLKGKTLNVISKPYSISVIRISFK
jgi:alpha-L-arabinofuranosidase